jgi:hypothetical protein
MILLPLLRFDSSSTALTVITSTPHSLDDSPAPFIDVLLDYPLLSPQLKPPEFPTAVLWSLMYWT